MTFEGFDAVPLIESAGFWPGATLPAEPSTDLAGTLDAQLRQAGRGAPVEPSAPCGCGGVFGRASARAEATAIDLWINQPGDDAFRPLERPNLAASVAWHALLAQSGYVFDFDSGMKSPALRADFIQPDPGNYDDANGNGQYDEGEEITVTGTRPKTVDDDGAPWEPKPGDDIGGGEKGGGPGVTTDEPRDTPCVEASPIGVDLREINRQALAAVNDIPRQNAAHFEYGSILFEKDGVVGRTPVFTQFDAFNIDWNAGVGAIPDGARVLAILHNHPASGSANPGLPSSDSLKDDWDAYDAVVNWGGTRGITVDPNLLMYIYTNKDGKTYVYDKTDRNTTRLSCSL